MESNFESKISEEINRFKNVINVHDLPEIFHYYSNKFLKPKINCLGFADINDIYISFIKKNSGKKNFKILSVGSGNCDLEVNIAQKLFDSGIDNFEVTCMDINKQMLDRGYENARNKGFNDRFTFLSKDINNSDIEEKFDIIMASHSLHHFVELEAIFDKIYASLDDEGYFIAHDMIGRNGHMRWPEALKVIESLWGVLDKKYKYNHLFKRTEEKFCNWDCSKEGFEGIRSQDILRLLVDKFNFELFLGFNNLIDVFVDRAFGHNFDVNSDNDRAFIDHIAELDDFYLESGKIKPTQMAGVMSKHISNKLKIYKNLSPEFCIRMTNL